MGRRRDAACRASPVPARLYRRTVNSLGSPFERALATQIGADPQPSPKSVQCHARMSTRAPAHGGLHVEEHRGR
eukprot:scaffold276938_cov32-Tisochrysis_lutea.AAC.3